MKKPTFLSLQARQVKALERIAVALETVVDNKKKTLRMVDIDRARVYGKHLGNKLRK